MADGDPDVFLSYSRKNSDFVRDLHAYLVEKEKDVWVDWEDIPVASEWRDDIARNIVAAAGFVFVVSATSLASAECSKEVDHAIEHGKRIVPIVCDDSHPGQSREEIRKLNWVLCRDRADREEAFARVLLGLDTDLEWTREHARLSKRAVEWEQSKRNSSFLMRGSDLQSAEAALAAGAAKDPAPTELQSEYVLTSRRAATRRQRVLLGGVSVALAVAIGLGVLSLLQRNDARRATKAATSVALATGANDRVEAHPEQALLLALAAYESSPSAQARGAVLTALEQAQKIDVSQFLHGDSDVTSVAWSPDRSTVAIGSADGSVRLWDIHKNQELSATAAQGANPSVGVGFGAGDLMEASRNGIVRLVHVAGRAADQTFRAPGKIAAAAISPNGRFVAAADGKRHIWLWDRRSGSRRQLPAPAGDPAALAFSHDGRTLAAGLTNYNWSAPNDPNAPPEIPSAVAVYDTTRATLLGRLPDQQRTVYGLAFAVRGDLLATAGTNSKYLEETGSETGAVRVWKARQLQQFGRAVIGKQPVRTVGFLPGGRVVAGRDDGTLQVASPQTGKWVGWTRHPLGGAVDLLAVSSDGRAFAAATSADTTVRLGPLRSRLTLGRTVGGAGDSFDKIAFSADGKHLLATSGAPGPVRLVNVRTGAILSSKWLHPGSDPDQVAFSPDGSTLALTDVDSRKVRLWNAQTHKAEGYLPGPRGAVDTYALAFNQSGTELAASYGNSIRLWDVPDRKLIAQTALSNVFHLMFSGSTLFTITDRSVVNSWDGHSMPRRIFNPPTGADDLTTLWKLIAELPRNGGAIALDTAALSPDGKTLAYRENAVGAGVELWDVATRSPLGPALPASDGTSVAFSPDGTVLAAGAGGGPIEIWRGLLWSHLADLKSRICSLVLGGFSASEWTAIEPGIARPNPCG